MVITVRKAAFGLAGVLLGGSIGLPPVRAVAAPPKSLTTGEVRTLPTHELARQILGERLAAKVIEAVRHNYDSDADPIIPDYVEFYTQPELTNPRINGICRTDVFTVDYGTEDTGSQSVSSSTAVHISHVQAKGRYKSFPIPPGEPGTPENDRAQAEACAQMTTALDAFRAPSAGDAQWLAAMEAEYSDQKSQFPFSCSDFADRSCVKARHELPQLKLKLATNVESIHCSNKRKGDQLDLCYRLSFPYPGEKCSDRQDSSDFECGDLEWVLTVFAGIKYGDSPVRILSLHLEHQPKTIPVP